MAGEKLRVLVVGGGAREHALVKSIVRSPRVSETLALPGNAGIARHARCLAGRADDVAQVVEAARREQVDLVVVGPEAPLCAGLVDALAEVGIPPSVLRARRPRSKARRPSPSSS